MSKEEQDDLDLIETLEHEGLLSKGTAKRLRRVARIADAAGRERLKLIGCIACLFVACIDFAVAASTKLLWLGAFCGSTTGLLVIVAIGLLFSWSGRAP